MNKQSFSTKSNIWTIAWYLTLSWLIYELALERDIVNSHGLNSGFDIGMNYLSRGITLILTVFAGAMLAKNMWKF